jgi:hypothetical protein
MKNTRKIFLYLIIAFGIIATFTPSLSQAKIDPSNFTKRLDEMEKPLLAAITTSLKDAKQYFLQSLNKIEKISESIPELIPYLPQIKEFLHTFAKIIEEISNFNFKQN